MRKVVLVLMALIVGTAFFLDFVAQEKRVIARAAMQQNQQGQHSNPHGQVEQPGQFRQHGQQHQDPTSHVHSPAQQTPPSSLQQKQKHTQEEQHEKQTPIQSRQEDPQTHGLQ